MRKRGLGVLLVLTFALVAAALVQAFRFEIFIAREQSSAQSIDRSFALLDAAIAHLRAAQAGYVAAGQDPDVWMKRATGLITEINERLATLQTATRSDEARPRYDAAATATGSLMELDRRVRADVTNGEQRLASEVIFVDALEAARRLDAELASARDAEGAASQARVANFRKWQLGLLGGAFGIFTIISLVVFGYVPGAQQPAPVTAPAPAPIAAAPVQRAPVPVVASPRVDRRLTEAADVCGDLARVLDVRDVPPLLARAADALGATGLVLWITNSERTMLNPSLSHGYPDKTLQRLGTLKADAENPTSRAFRSMQTQMVKGRTPGSNGAIAVPLVTATGCLGVLAAEVKAGVPDEGTLAIARMLAAQLATLFSPVADGNVQKTVTA